MHMKKTCSVMSYDYRGFHDPDVYLNVKLFYQSAGYRVFKNKVLPDADLLVLLRGNPAAPDHNYTDVVHAYDYQRPFKPDWKALIPNARRIFLISPTRPQLSDGVTYIQGYLPVIPDLWQGSFKKKDRRPVHISHFKPIGQDRLLPAVLSYIKERSFCLTSLPFFSEARSLLYRVAVFSIRYLPKRKAH